jgi:hypothetical protein
MFIGLAIYLRIKPPDAIILVLHIEYEVMAMELYYIRERSAKTITYKW